MVLLSAVDGEYYYFRFVSAILKMLEHSCLHYFIFISGWRISFRLCSRLTALWRYMNFVFRIIKIYYTCQRYACFIAIHVCRDKIYSTDIQSLLYRSVAKPKADIMMPSFVSEAQIIQ